MSPTTAPVVTWLFQQRHRDGYTADLKMSHHAITHLSMI